MERDDLQELLTVSGVYFRQFGRYILHISDVYKLFPDPVQAVQSAVPIPPNQGVHRVV